MNITSMSMWVPVAISTMILSTAVASGRLGDRLKERRAEKSGAGTPVARTIQHDGRERDYLLYVPESYSKDKAAPVVFVLHGGKSSAAKMVTFSDFPSRADRDGVILVYPSAVDENWNDGRGVESMTSQKENVDDVGLMAAILDVLEKEYNVDKKRVYATGISNGGIMSQRLAIELSDRIAAIAPVAGSIAKPLAAKFAPKEPVSVMMFNGTDDPLVPFEGGFVSKNRGEVISTAEATKKWVARNECKGPKNEKLPDVDPEDKCTVERDAYTGGLNGTDVILYTIHGGGHTWPGGHQYMAAFIIGIASQDVNATDLIWEFFKKHAKP